MLGEILIAGLEYLAKENVYYSKEREVTQRMKLSYAAARNMKARGASDEEIDKFLEDELKRAMYKEFKAVCDKSVMSEDA